MVIACPMLMDGLCCVCRVRQLNPTSPDTSMSAAGLASPSTTNAVTRGNETLAAVFKDRLYFFSSEDRLQRFMKTPWK